MCADVSREIAHYRSFSVDAFDANFEDYPLAQYAAVMECVVEAGEVLFVPAGSPHAVSQRSGAESMGNEILAIGRFA